MRLKPSGSKWIKAEAEQYFTTAEPCFIWKVATRFSPLIPIVGWDRFTGGKGIMNIRAFAIFNIINAGGPKIDEGSLQRYLSEICWFPSAALQPYINWEAIDSKRAKATMQYNNCSGSVIFTISDEGEVIQCNANRYMGNDMNSKKELWEIRMTKTAAYNGILIPSECEVTWKLKNGDFTWYKLAITDIAFNYPVLYK